MVSIIYTVLQTLTDEFTWHTLLHNNIKKNWSHHWTFSSPLVMPTVIYDVCILLHMICSTHERTNVPPRRLYHSPILLREDNTATILAVAVVGSFWWCYAPNWFERYKYTKWTRTNLILIRVSSLAFSNLSLLLSLLPKSALRSIKLDIARLTVYTLLV